MTVVTDDGGLMQQYMEISWRFSQAKAETLQPQWSIAIDLEPGYDLPNECIHNISE